MLESSKEVSMVMLVLKNWKAVVGLITMLLVPMMLASWGFILSTSQTNAKAPLLESRIVKLEQNSYAISAQYKMIQESLIIIQNREYEELKQARQERLKNKE